MAKSFPQGTATLTEEKWNDLQHPNYVAQLEALRQELANGLKYGITDESGTSIGELVYDNGAILLRRYVD